MLQLPTMTLAKSVATVYPIHNDIWLGSCGQQDIWGPRERVMRTLSKFLLQKLEHNNASKGNSKVCRYLDKSGETSLAPSHTVYTSCYSWEGNGRILR